MTMHRVAASGRTSHRCCWLLLGASSLLSTSCNAQTSETRCAALAKLHLSDAEVTSVQFFAAGLAPAVAADMLSSGRLADLPARCEATVLSHPAADSAIRLLLWLPEQAAWNKRILAVGNGGYSSQLSSEQMASALRQGYVVGGSDTGHTGDSLAFGTGHPEKIRDWAYRSTHVLAQAERAAATSFYSQTPEHAYFRGCSTGGQQALSEAQRYPRDFDGISAGDPGNDRILLNADFVESWKIAHPAGATPFPQSKLKLLHQRVMEACDAQDGIVDGVIADPQRCDFDPVVLQCKEQGEGSDCLTPAEVGMVRTLYAGAVRDGKNKPLFPGWARGSEGGWGAYLVGPTEPVRMQFWSDWVYADPSLSPPQFDSEKAIRDARAKLPYVEAVSPDLRAFREGGGKLLLYHGWADPVVPPEDTIRYFDKIRRVLGTSTAWTAELFMVPGMYHCGGGPGASSFDDLAALDRWVTSGQQPKTMLATHLEGATPAFTRPLCPYPQQARWDGQHDPKQASSFVCRGTPREITSPK